MKMDGKVIDMKTVLPTLADYKINLNLLNIENFGSPP
jgi:hypothetical protein